MLKTPLSKNLAIIACAGSGKTKSLVDAALEFHNEKILLTTYTHDAKAQIVLKIKKRLGYVPANIVIKTWQTFQLQQCVKPYQSFILGNVKIRSIYFENFPYHLGNGTFLAGRNIYKDKLGQFICISNKLSDGLVVGRLEEIYDHILIDEAQDLKSYDLDFLKLLFHSKIKVTLVGDPRQRIFQTCNLRYGSRIGFNDWVVTCSEEGLLDIIEKNITYRCAEDVCKFANTIFPELPQSISHNNNQDDHQGIIFIPKSCVDEYVKKYSDDDLKLLKFSKSTDTMGYDALNIGLSKGEEYKRILIFPTIGMKKFLKSENPLDIGSREKFYVAVTRAKMSIAFVCAKPSKQLSLL